MTYVKEADPATGVGVEDDYDAEIAALDGAPTGAPLMAKDWIFLALSGLVLPILILIWGWA